MAVTECETVFTLCAEGSGNGDYEEGGEKNGNQQSAVVTKQGLFYVPNVRLFGSCTEVQCQVPMTSYSVPSVPSILSTTTK